MKPYQLGLTSSASGVEEPGLPDEEWATGTRQHRWARPPDLSISWTILLSD